MDLMHRQRQQSMAGLQKQMDRLFGQLGHIGFPGMFNGLQSFMSSPAIDVYKTDTEVVLSAELPGLAAKDIDLEITEDSVRLSGETRQESEINEDNYFWSERRFGAFSRTVPLPALVKEKEAKASFKDGVLTVRAPLAERAAEKGTHKITIEG